MIKSMTGFASLTRDDERGTIGVTIRAVNHRFLDLQLRLPTPLSSLEPPLRALVQKRLGRGRIEIGVSLQTRQVPVPRIELNAEFAQALSAAMEQAREKGLVSGLLTPGDLLRLPQALTIQDQVPEAGGLAEALAAPVETAVDEAIEQLETMRVREGQHLRLDLDARKALLADLIVRIGAAANTGREDLEGRLMERARELAASMPIDQAALAQEVVRIAQRSDISEEVTRFHGHLAHWDALSESPEPCGRKLDFLLQEMNREINTIGSKADGLQVSEVVIQAKAEMEKMREQVRMSSSDHGLLFIISAASGTGKTTLAERLVQILPNLRMSRSFTSRAARAGERDGVDYNFVTRAHFEGMIRRQEFLEWADVFGNFYGTCRPDTEALLASGQDVVLVIDVQGARQVEATGIDHTAIFVLPPSFQILERRLRGRSADSEEAMQRRLATARAEVGSYVDYDYVVINDRLEPTVVRLQEIIAAERSRTHRMSPMAEEIIKSFEK